MAKAKSKKALMLGGQPAINGAPSLGTINFSVGSPGTASLSITGTTYTNTAMMGYQVNLNNPQAISGNFSGGTWSLTLTTYDCPTPGGSYSITVYAWTGSGSFPSSPARFTRGT